MCQLNQLYAFANIIFLVIVVTTQDCETAFEFIGRCLCQCWCRCSVFTTNIIDITQNAPCYALTASDEELSCFTVLTPLSSVFLCLKWKDFPVPGIKRKKNDFPLIDSAATLNIVSSFKIQPHIIFDSISRPMSLTS